MIYSAVEGWETQTPRVKRVEMICETTYYEARASRGLPPVVDGKLQEDLSLFFFSSLWCLYLSCLSLLFLLFSHGPRVRPWPAKPVIHEPTLFGRCQIPPVGPDHHMIYAPVDHLWSACYKKALTVIICCSLSFVSYLSVQGSTGCNMDRKKPFVYYGNVFSQA